MNPSNTTNADNPLGIAPVGSLLAKFAIPAIISMLVNALYNIVDQIFIGQGVGMLGNAATNIAFPVTTISTAAALQNCFSVPEVSVLVYSYAAPNLFGKQSNNPPDIRCPAIYKKFQTVN